jgi:hypothetical protein
MTDRRAYDEMGYPSMNTIYQDYINNLSAQNRHISQMLSHFQSTEMTLRRMINSRPRTVPIRTTVIHDQDDIPQEDRPVEAVLNDLPRWASIFRRPNVERFLASSPVPVAPTQEQVANASRVCLFQDIEDPINAICPITQQPFNLGDPVMRLNHCGHIFSVTSINEWFSNHVRCPVCRHDIRDQPLRRPRRVSLPPPPGIQLPDEEHQVEDDDPVTDDADREAVPDAAENEREPPDEEDTQTPAGAEDGGAGSMDEDHPVESPGEEFGLELERSLLASLADTLNQELSRTYNSGGTPATIANLEGVTQRAFETDPSGNIQYSFRFGGQSR